MRCFLFNRLDVFFFSNIYITLHTSYLNVSSAGGDPNVIRQLEARRQRALGTESSDILPKVLEDQLSRSDGENSGLISGGLGRLLGRYELIGIASDSIGLDANMEKNETGGGSPDASFSKRYHGETILPTPNVPAGMVSYFCSIIFV